ncbi:MAG: hypothetical protein HKL96_09675 [Phycisphaerales bacterium]|nr:hypothetical protein [Phycisphaerales bacterium]
MENNDSGKLDDELRLSGLLRPKPSRASSTDVKGRGAAAKPVKAATPQAAPARGATSNAPHCETVAQQIPLTEELIPMMNKNIESEPIVTEGDLSNLARLARASANRKRPRKNKTWGAVATFVILALLASGVMLEAYMFGKSGRINKHVIAGPQYALTATSSPQTQPLPNNVNAGPSQPAAPLRILHHAPGELFDNNNH